MSDNYVNGSQPVPREIRVEIERKFLVRRLPSQAVRLPGDEIAQGYLAVDESSEVRIRRIGGRCFQAVKQGSGLERREVEVPLTEEQFDSLWPATAGRRLEKVRHRVAHAGRTIELDVYGGALEGLVIAEVEFVSVEDSRAFTAPDWFGGEVTADDRYRNSSLALRGAPRRAGR
jgi:CYTH domain-containing protein